MYQGEPSTQPATLYVASAVRDAAGVHAAPGAVAIRAGRIIAAGPVEPVLTAAGPDAQRIDLDHRLLTPGFVNAHTHLDLTGVGFRPYGGDFVGWIKMVMAERKLNADSVASALLTGLKLSYEAGVLTIGDVAASLDAVKARAGASPPFRLRGTSYLECFGFGREAAVQAELAENALRRIPSHGINLELQPHAPYSAGLEVYEVAHNYLLGRPCTHLAETPEELQLVRDGTGPLAELLHELGKWHDSIGPTGKTPIEYLHDQLQWGFWLLVHCNYVSDGDIQFLGRESMFLSECLPAAEQEDPVTGGVTRRWHTLRRVGQRPRTGGNLLGVAYCPRASEYFGHRDHRYRDMLAAGVNVCLGTDSVICHGSLSILDEMRRLYQRDRTSPELLLKMATINGMRGLGLDGRNATFAPGADPGVLAIRYDPRPGIDPLEQVLASESPPQIEVLEGTGSV